MNQFYKKSVLHERAVNDENSSDTQYGQHTMVMKIRLKRPSGGRMPTRWTNIKFLNDGIIIGEMHTSLRQHHRNAWEKIAKLLVH